MGKPSAAKTDPVPVSRSPIRQDRHPGASANKRSAESHALALVPTIRKLLAAGSVSRHALADELNRRGIPTARGGSWHYTTVVRLLTRLRLLAPGKGARIHNGRAGKQAADEQAKALASTIRALQVEGLASLSAIARELNAREIPSARGGKWHPATVNRLLHRLAPSRRLRSSSQNRR
jgi:hypothetical protein